MDATVHPQPSPCTPPVAGAKHACFHDSTANQALCLASGFLHGMIGGRENDVAYLGDVLWIFRALSAGESRDDRMMAATPTLDDCSMTFHVE